MRDLIIAIAVFGSIPFILKRTYIGVLVWSVLGYLNPHRLSWGFAYNFPFSQIVAITTIISLIFSREPKKIPWSSATVVWLIWLIWMSITTYTAIDPSHSVWEWERTMKIQVLVLITLLTINDVKKLNALVWVIVVSIGFYGVKGGMFTLLTGGNYLVWGPADTHIAGNNEIAFALVMIFPLMYYLYSTTKNKKIRLILLACMLLVTVSVIGSYSRGAFLSISAMGFLLFLRSKKKLLIGSVIVILAVSLLSFIPDKWSERMGTIQTYDEDASAMGRINSWYFAANLANEYPIVGGGFDTFSKDLFQIYAPVPHDHHDAHSIYFEVLAEHGYVGLLIFLLLGIVTLKIGSSTIRTTKGIPELQWAYILASMVQASMIGYAVGGAFLGLAYFDLYYHLIAMQIIIRKIVNDTLSEENTDVDTDADTKPTRKVRHKKLPG